jgi:hypothetical protein
MSVRSWRVQPFTFTFTFTAEGGASEPCHGAAHAALQRESHTLRARCASGGGLEGRQRGRDVGASRDVNVNVNVNVNGNGVGDWESLGMWEPRERERERGRGTGGKGVAREGEETATAGWLGQGGYGAALRHQLRPNRTGNGNEVPAARGRQSATVPVTCCHSA